MAASRETIDMNMVALPFMSLWRFGVIFACLVGVLTGCSGKGLPDSVSVSGRVMLDGEPLEQGMVRFAPVAAGGHLAIGELGKGGWFTMNTTKSSPGVLKGAYKVSVLSDKPYEIEFDPLNPPADLPPPESYIPRRYNKIDTSGLAVEVTAPIRDLLFELSSN